MSNNNSDSIWYALYTKSRAEKKVSEDLNKKGIRNYLPLRRELRKWSDRKKWVETPAISSYIFINISPEQYNWVFEINGVVAYVAHNGRAVTIPDNQIKAMQQTIENKIAFDVESNAITKGKEITISSGPLIGVKGIVKKVKGNRKLYIDISNIGYSLVIDMEDVEVE
ncbi:UpxY family transcription antiterminator [Saccharicrinis aurantiacus]|uniref:UpxY family transcription antiterminator n=1 Tax=Saccharicrinis aurantiacus TaxID=1849719 RepID=UPI0024906A7F|nr:UpxY family transcription antiterminator [Saccharicrinis aurantiacus]